MMQTLPRAAGVVPYFAEVPLSAVGVGLMPTPTAQDAKTGKRTLVLLYGSEHANASE